ncbi:MAG TPA: hypothetical protein PLR88_01790 [Bacteroidales bacterium]|nr:hypothetical protein [Bacteroidales bacterium]HPT20652.1 hypothetical protein [Bacteroidales bacterium]
MAEMLKNLAGCPVFQFIVILHGDRVTGIRDRRRDSRRTIEVRCRDCNDIM